ncbi:hypothetical protein [Methanobacterium petrolearium]|uniref:hypothetical protein n=1 Tax=Methanobacterium petrolearium TaxID=710190 RepID=UPI001AE9D5E1|nr:hypothetical protein [Methanobacterium petrolearium]MBP1944804.1 hypothetical protein [Methanobacterium petrolearium]
MVHHHWRISIHCIHHLKNLQRQQLGITPITSNATTPKNTQVTAATKTGNTVGMQNTGTPINYMILVILLIVSGMIMPKRR